MNQLAGFPYIGVEITKDGVLENMADLNHAKDFVADHAITDLFVVSHGWNNNMNEARDLYKELFESIRAVLDEYAINSLVGRKFGVLGIFWPSKRFTDRDLIPGGGAAGIGAGDESVSEIASLLDELDDALDSSAASAAIADVKAIVTKLDSEQTAREIFASKIRSILPQDAITDDDGSDNFFAVDSEKLFRRLEAPIKFKKVRSSSGGAAGGVGSIDLSGGGAAGIGDFFRGTRAAARRILNLSTYYLMKARAGKVGAGGVYEVLSSIRQTNRDTKIHLLGHSFGGRVVASAAMALGATPTTRPNSMVLLQAAFSHNGFAKEFDGSRNGHFRSVVSDGMVLGPILITHTHNDKANATAYPIASRVAGQDAAALVGGPRDKLGAIGANGAQHTPETVPGSLLSTGSDGYAFKIGRIYNLRADDYIENHGDVTGQQEAYAILRAVASTS